MVDTVAKTELGTERKVFCRCWKSAKVRCDACILPALTWLQFPYCDGAHNAHNTATGDNVGPLVIAAE